MTKNFPSKIRHTFKTFQMDWFKISLYYFCRNVGIINVLLIVYRRLESKFQTAVFCKKNMCDMNFKCKSLMLTLNIIVVFKWTWSLWNGLENECKNEYKFNTKSWKVAVITIIERFFISLKLKLISQGIESLEKEFRPYGSIPSIS